jgi:hypothetical protein
MFQFMVHMVIFVGLASSLKLSTYILYLLFAAYVVMCHSMIFCKNSDCILLCMAFKVVISSVLNQPFVAAGS